MGLVLALYGADWRTNRREIGHNRAVMDAPRCCLTVFTKPARPGLVKTRLLGELSAEQAAFLHSAFLQDLLERMQVGGFETRLAWAVGAQEALPQSSFEAFRQTGEELGDRLFEGLSAVLTEFELVAAVGSDHPDLPAAVVGEAFERLASGCDVVLGPAADGGYYLVGVKRRTIRRAMFSGIDWSTDRVLQQTLDRCYQLGLSVEELTVLEDVDTPADLRRLASRLAACTGPSSPATRSLLEEWGMIPVPGRTQG